MTKPDRKKKSLVGYMVLGADAIRRAKDKEGIQIPIIYYQRKFAPKGNFFNGIKYKKIRITIEEL